VICASIATRKSALAWYMNPKQPSMTVRANAPIDNASRNSLRRFTAAPWRLAGRGDLNGGNCSTGSAFANCHLVVIIMAYATALFLVRFE